MPGYDATRTSFYELGTGVYNLQTNIKRQEERCYKRRILMLMNMVVVIGSTHISKTDNMCKLFITAVSMPGGLEPFIVQERSENCASLHY